ncbi:hypothetical protein TNCV_611001 [Trichonephila clavipes]|nr:hypothetical protein TNCV_611001 [Trichonephila clavipes]
MERRDPFHFESRKRVKELKPELTQHIVGKANERCLKLHGKDSLPVEKTPESSTDHVSDSPTDYVPDSPVESTDSHFAN